MRNRLVFYVNGERREVAGLSAGLTLSDYLRGAPHGGRALPGTKIACAEGDCGACTVLVGKPEEKAGKPQLVYRTVDACIAFVYQMDRRHVVTVEGLAADHDLTRVQSAMVDCHGSQCGFCTPGFVMAMHGVLEETPSEVGADAWRLGLSGNLCRCTGYQQILDAAGACASAERFSVGARFDEASMLSEFASLGDGLVHINPQPENGTNGHPPTGVEAWLPSSLSELLNARAARPNATLVAGATDIGVQHNHGRIDPTGVIVTSHVPELQKMEVVCNELVIGAAVPWSEIEAFAAERLPEYHSILTRFGSPQVRHVGTLAGNLANASPIADSIPMHYVTGSILEIASAAGRREVPIAEFYRGYKDLDLRPDELITAVRTPLPAAGEHLFLYKISKRRDMDISTVTLALLFRLDGDRIENARLAAGGVGPTVLRLFDAERELTGSELSVEAFQAAGQAAADEVAPITDVRGGASYRRLLIQNLFTKCWHEFCGQQTRSNP